MFYRSLKIIHKNTSVCNFINT